MVECCIILHSLGNVKVLGYLMQLHDVMLRNLDKFCRIIELLGLLSLCYPLLIKLIDKLYSYQW